MTSGKVVLSSYVDQYRHSWKLKTKLPKKKLAKPDCEPLSRAADLASAETRYATGPAPFEQMPGPKPSLPLIGTNWIYFPFIGYYQSMKLHEANLDKFHRYGPVMKEEYQRGCPAVTVFDLKEIRKIFRNEKECPARPVLPYIIKHRLSDPSRYANAGLANMLGKEWLSLRSQLAPLLLSEGLKKRYIETQNWVANRLVLHIENILQADGDVALGFNQGLVADTQEMFYRFSMESIMNLCLNQRLECLNISSGHRNVDSVREDGEKIFQAAMNLFEAQHKLYYGGSWWKYFNTSSYRQLCESQDTIHDIVSKYIDQAKSDLHRKRFAMAANTQPSESLLETLYNANKLSDLEIKSTIVDFIGGGIYTVANTLTMTLFLLAANPRVQERLYKEICQVFEHETLNEDDIHVDLDKLEQLKFLRMCLKEANRLLPTIPGLARTLQEDMVLSNYNVPKGTLVFCNLMVASRLPQYFENPNTFNPSRWERNGEPLGELAFSVLPFGHGKRKCIGHNFAKLEINIALAKLIKNFHVSTVNNQDLDSLDLSYKFIVVPEKPVALRFQLRKSAVCQGGMAEETV